MWASGWMGGWGGGGGGSMGEGDFGHLAGKSHEL